MVEGKVEAGRNARELLLRECRGVLSTHSVDMPGYPFGSVVPYSLDRSGMPVILISSIAQHTRNLLADPRLSLIVSEREAADVQASSRLTLLADAGPLGDDVDARERYYRLFPQAHDYHRTHDFAFFRLEVVRARYIGGFGEIHWLEPSEIIKANPFSRADESRIVEHMNADHSDALRHCCRCAHIPLAEEDAARMAGADGEGFHLIAGSRLHWLAYPAPASNLAEARQALVAMARRAC
jgi:putative heme iron utilization protein